MRQDRGLEPLLVQTDSSSEKVQAGLDDSGCRELGNWLPADILLGSQSRQMWGVGKTLTGWDPITDPC